MVKKLLVFAVAAAFVSASGAASAYVGGNGIPKYDKTEASKNKKATNDGVGPNTAPSYSKTEASKNQTVTNHGAGPNGTPSYPKAGTH
jgi:hypothetical protein